MRANSQNLRAWILDAIIDSGGHLHLARVNSEEYLMLRGNVYGHKKDFPELSHSLLTQIENPDALQPHSWRVSGHHWNAAISGMERDSCLTEHSNTRQHFRAVSEYA